MVHISSKHNLSTKQSDDLRQSKTLNNMKENEELENDSQTRKSKRLEAKPKITWTRNGAYGNQSDDVHSGNDTDSEDDSHPAENNREETDFKIFTSDIKHRLDKPDSINGQQQHQRKKKDILTAKTYNITNKIIVASQPLEPLDGDEETETNQREPNNNSDDNTIENNNVDNNSENNHSENTNNTSENVEQWKYTPPTTRQQSNSEEITNGKEENRRGRQQNILKPCVEGKSAQHSNS